MEVTNRLRNSATSPWSALERALDGWGESGRIASFWWRDDDATRPGPALDRLLECRDGAPLTIAAIPAGVREALADRLLREDRVSVIQHGYSHRNLAPPEARKSEFPAGGRPTAALRRLTRGRQRLAGLFGPRFTPVLAPPWNRIDPALAQLAGRSGWRALSGFGEAPAAGWINTHLDPIDWRGTRGFVGEAGALEILVAQLHRRRPSGGNPAAPIGLLTHHRDNDAASWAFIRTLVERIARHPAARWVSIQDIVPNAGV